MDHFSSWVPLLVSLVGSAGLVAINIYTVRSNNKRDVARDKSQHHHDELMIASEQAHAARGRMAEQKHAAFRDLLTEVTMTGPRYHAFSTERISGYFDVSGLQSAASQAKLLSTAASRARISTIMDDFRSSYYASGLATETALVDVLADELNDGHV